MRTKYKVPSEKLCNSRSYSINYRSNKLKADGTLTGQDLIRQYHIQRGKCFHCSRTLDPTCGRCFEIDHLEPFYRGGKNDPDNIVISCVSCNRRKGQMPLYQWIMVLASKGYVHPLGHKVPGLAVQLLLPFREENELRLVV